MSRSLSTDQARIPKALRWLCIVGAVYASSEPGIIVAGNVYDLEMHTVLVTVGMSLSDHKQAPVATFSLIGGTPAPGDAVDIWSLHGNLTEPLLQFSGIVSQVGTSADGTANVSCVSTVLTEIPSVTVAGSAIPVPVGRSEITPAIMRATNHDIVNPPTWGIKVAEVTSDAMPGDVLKAVAAAPTLMVDYLTHPDTHSANTAWKISEFIPGIIDEFTVPSGTHHYVIGFTAPQGVNLSPGITLSLSVYIGVGLPYQQTIQGAVYEDDAGALGALLGVYTNFAGGAAPLPVSFFFQGSKMTPGQSYWLLISLNSNYINTLGGSAAEADTGHITYEYTINGVGGVLTPIAFDWALSFKQTFDMSEMHGVPITVASASVADRVGVWISGTAFIGLWDALNNQIEMVSIHSATLAYVEVPLTSQLPPGNYTVVLYLYAHATSTAILGVDNAAGDGANATYTMDMTTGVWSLATFDMAFHFSTKGAQVEWFFNAASLGVQNWQTDIVASSGDLIVRAADQSGQPAYGEQVTVTVGSMPKLALGVQWGGRSISSTDIVTQQNGNSLATPLISGNIASVPSAWILTTSGPTFTPTITAIAAAIRIYSTFDYSAAGDQVIQIRSGSATGSTSTIVASGKLAAQRVTANRWITVTLDKPVLIISGTQYWITSSNSGLGGLANTVDVVALSLTEATEIIDGISVYTATLSHAVLPSALVVELRNGAVLVNQPNDIRDYLLALTTATLDSSSRSSLTTRYLSNALTLGGVLRAQTVHDALAEIDRHTRTMSALAGNLLYLIDGDATPAANVLADEKDQLSGSTSAFGAIITRVAYSYNQGADSDSYSDAVLEASVPRKSASMNLDLLPDATNASASAIWRLAMLGLQQRRRPLLISDMAAMPGDVLDIAGTLHRITHLRVGNPNICDVVEI